MRKAFFPLAVVSLIGVFLFSTLVCCCVRHLVQDKKVSSCCHKTAKSDPVKCTDGCSSLVKSAEKTKTFDLSPAPLILAQQSFTPEFSLKPVHITKSIFINGPPGPFTAVPLYTQFHSLRI